MQTWIALFRGINVGGRNIIKMADLRRDLESLELSDVRTYIQSGNVVFGARAKTASRLAGKIAKMLEEQHGFRPRIIVFGKERLLQALDANPFPEAVSDPKSLHFFFLEKAPSKPDVEALQSVKSPTEEFVLTDSVFYLHTPDRLATSKLAATAEKHLGVAATARNFRTVDQLRIMVQANS